MSLDATYISIGFRHCTLRILVYSNTLSSHGAMLSNLVSEAITTGVISNLSECLTLLALCLTGLRFLINPKFSLWHRLIRIQ